MVDTSWYVEWAALELRVDELKVPDLETRSVNLKTLSGPFGYVSVSPVSPVLTL